MLKILVLQEWVLFFVRGHWEWWFFVNCECSEAIPSLRLLNVICKYCHPESCPSAAEGTQCYGMKVLLQLADPSCVGMTGWKAARMEKSIRNIIT